MAKEKIKITLKKIVFKRGGKKIPGTGTVAYDATIDGRPVGKATTMFQQAKGTKKFLRSRKMAVHELNWSAEVDTKKKDQVVVSVTCKDNDKTSPTTVGTVNLTLKRPYKQLFGAMKDANPARFLLTYDVELDVKGYGRHPPNTVFTTRQTTNSVTSTTVSGMNKVVRLEFHPVGPTPWVGLPARPPVAVWELPRVNNHAAVALTANSAPNAISNPVVIPILAPPLPARRSGVAYTNAEKDAAPWANDRNAARIEYTWYYPRSMNFRDDDDRLTWKVTAVSGTPSVKFLGKAKGTKVKVYGTGSNEGSVLLEVWYKELKLAVYRALVQKIKKVRCRFNIFRNMDSNDPNDSPASNAASIGNYVKILNCLLRQAGLELELDDSQEIGLVMTGWNKKLTAPDGSELRADLKYVTRILQNGIWEIRVPRGYTLNGDTNTIIRAAKTNARENVLNFTLITTCAGGNPLGAAAYWEDNPAGSPYSDTGNPSSSWRKKSGVQYRPDNKPAACDSINMTLLAPVLDKPGSDGIFGMGIADRLHGSASEMANTIAHEFGHVIGLNHRLDEATVTDDPFPDGVGYPHDENLMHPDNPATIAQDIDMIQTRVMHRSPLVR